MQRRAYGGPAADSVNLCTGRLRLLGAAAQTHTTLRRFRIELTAQQKGGKNRRVCVLERVDVRRDCVRRAVVAKVKVGPRLRGVRDGGDAGQGRADLKVLKHLLEEVALEVVPALVHGPGAVEEEEHVDLAGARVRDDAHVHVPSRLVQHKVEQEGLGD